MIDQNYLLRDALIRRLDAYLCGHSTEATAIIKDARAALSQPAGRNQDDEQAVIQICERIGYGRVQQIAGIAWDAKHKCAPRGRMGVTVKDQQQQERSIAAFREAVQEECDLLHIPMPVDAREAVKAVVAANVRIALDPAVSREAQALIDQGKAQASNPVA